MRLITPWGTGPHVAHQHKMMGRSVPQPKVLNFSNNVSIKMLFLHIGTNTTTYKSCKFQVCSLNSFFSPQQSSRNLKINFGKLILGYLRKHIIKTLPATWIFDKILLWLLLLIVQFLLCKRCMNKISCMFII